MCHWLSTDLRRRLSTCVIEYRPVSFITYQHMSSTLNRCHWVSTCAIAYRHVPSTIDMCHRLSACVINYDACDVTGCTLMHRVPLLLSTHVIEYVLSTINTCYRLLTCVIDTWPGYRHVLCVISFQPALSTLTCVLLFTLQLTLCLTN